MKPATLKQYVQCAMKERIETTFANGGGWCRMAEICGGGPGFTSKKQATRFLMSRFPHAHEVWAPSNIRPAKKQKPYTPRVSLGFAATDEFLLSYEWRRVRMEALKLYGPVCQCCGASKANGVMIHVDHIKPRKLFPQLALDVANLQILCEVCNHGKGNWDMTDWRPVADDDAAKSHMQSIRGEN